MPFKKGDPNINRNGRPFKGASFPDVLSRILDEEIESKDGMDKKEALCRKLVKMAFDGESWAFNALMDRVDGKPTQKVEAEIQAEILSIPVHKFVDSPEE
jgi:hypothetical protein